MKKLFGIFRPIFFRPKFFFASQTPNSILSLVSLQNKLNSKKLNCKGCGIHLQTDDISKEGYIDLSKLQEMTDKEENLRVDKQENNKVKNDNNDVLYEYIQKNFIDSETQNNYHNIIPDEFIEPIVKDKKGKKQTEKIEINNIAVLQKLEEEKEKRGGTFDDSSNKFQKAKKHIIVCQRCHNLKNNANDFNKSEISINKYNMRDFLKNVYAEIKFSSLIVFIIDLSNLSATTLQEIYDLKKTHKSKIMVVVNKMDVLPKNISESKSRFYLRNYLKEKFSDVFNEDIFFVSSINGEGFDKIIDYFKKLKEANKYHKAYIVGCTNTGKSTFINTLIKKSNKFESNFYHDPFNKKNEQDGTNLTTSPIPSTTLKTNEIDGLHLGLKIYDTPGIPNEIIYPKILHNLLQSANLLILKKNLLVQFSLTKGKSLWVGGLFRIDFGSIENFTSEEILEIHSFFSFKINIHKTSISKANEYYINNYGNNLFPVYDKDIKNVIFQKRILDLDFTNEKNIEFEIPGIGCLLFSSTNMEKCEITLYIPDEVLFIHRKPLLIMNKEGNALKIERRIYTGKTRKKSLEKGKVSNI